MTSYACHLPDRGFIQVEGEESRDFLQRLVTCDMHKVDKDMSTYSALLTPQGKIQFDFFVSWTNNGFLLECERSRVNEFIKRLEIYRLRAPITFSDVSAKYTLYGLWNEQDQPLGLPNISGARTDLPAGFAIIDPRLAALGARLAVTPNKIDNILSTHNITLGNGNDYDLHRLQHGIPLVGQDFQPEEDFPLECNFEELNAIDFQKGCYIGQEVTSRTKRRGIVRKRLVPVFVQGAMPAPGTSIKAGGKAIGEIRSGKEKRAMALLRLDKTSDAFAEGMELVSDATRLIPLKPEWATYDLDDWHKEE